MKIVIISIGLILLLFFSNILNAKPKSCSGYFITKSGKVFRTTDMGWSWNEIKNFASVATNKERIVANGSNFLESSASENYTVSIFNVLGVEVLKLTLPGSMPPVKIGSIEGFKNLCRGLYFVRYNKNGSSYYEFFLNH